MLFCCCFFPSIQAVAESCYYGTEIPLPCMRNLKNWTLFSVASVLNNSYKNSIVFRLARHLCSSTSLVYMYICTKKQKTTTTKTNKNNNKEQQQRTTIKNNNKKQTKKKRYKTKLKQDKTKNSVICRKSSLDYTYCTYIYYLFFILYF